MQLFIQKLAQFVNKTVSLHQIELDEENIVKPLAIASGFIVILLHLIYIYGKRQIN